MFIRGGNAACAMMGAIGLDTVLSIEERYMEERKLPNLEGVPFLRKLVSDGKLGANRSKGGLYLPGHTTRRRPRATAGAIRHSTT